MSMSMQRKSAASPGRADLQRIVTRNVKILQAFQDLSRAQIAEAIGLTVDGIGHKFTGRAKWSLDDLVALAEIGGPHWPVDRFLTAPEGAEGAKTGYRARRAHRQSIVPRWGAVVLPFERRRSA